MTAAEGIAKLGFRRWYERQLIEGHIYFVTCFLSMIVVAAGLEQFDVGAPVLQQVWTGGLVVGSAFLCVKSLRWYSFLLARAETFGSQSNCPRCSAYGSLNVLDAGSAEPRSRDNAWIRVRCKKCGHEWRMDNA